MNRNNEISLSTLPRVDIQRSIFHRNFGHKTSFNVGQVIPFYIDEVLPGDTHNIKTSMVARLQTLLTPIMDNMYLDTYYFFVPNRLVWDHWKNFCGENEDGPWTMDKQEYEIPYLTYPSSNLGVEGTDYQLSSGFDIGTLADYMGVPVGIWFDPDPTHEGYEPHSNKNYPSALPFRAYAMIINEYFRDQNLQQPVQIHKDDTIREGVSYSYDDGAIPEDAYITDLELGGRPFVAARFHDYFSSCLPSPQKSPNISIFGGFNNGNAGLTSDYGPYAPVYSRNQDVVTVDQLSGLNAPTFVPTTGVKNTRSSGNKNSGTISAKAESSGANAMWFDPGEGSGVVADITLNNLWADLNIPEATINNLRMAFQLQKYYEKSARGGTRYREYLREFFGVSNGDARMQVPEYLGGHRVPLSIHQVANTAQSEGNKLGDLGAMSNTTSVHDDVHMSFTEHGYIIGLCVVRYDNTYSQGLERFWSRRNILDFYNPVFAHIGEQPVFTRELTLALPRRDLPDTPVFDTVFGYNEAWADYRYKPSRVSGEMRPEAPLSLASWHLADDYEYAPYLSSEWIKTDKGIVDRVLSISSSVSNQVFCDIFVSNKCVRPMPMHSIPGLADHF